MTFSVCALIHKLYYVANGLGEIPIEIEFKEKVKELGIEDIKIKEKIEEVKKWIITEIPLNSEILKLMK